MHIMCMQKFLQKSVFLHRRELKQEILNHTYSFLKLKNGIQHRQFLEEKTSSFLQIFFDIWTTHIFEFQIANGSTTSGNDARYICDRISHTPLDALNTMQFWTAWRTASSHVKNSFLKWPPISAQPARTPQASQEHVERPTADECPHHGRQQSSQFPDKRLRLLHSPGAISSGESTSAPLK